MNGRLLKAVLRVDRSSRLSQYLKHGVVAEPRRFDEGRVAFHISVVHDRRFKALFGVLKLV